MSISEELYKYDKICQKKHILCRASAVMYNPVIIECIPLANIHHCYYFNEGDRDCDVTYFCRCLAPPFTSDYVTTNNHSRQPHVPV